ITPLGDRPMSMSAQFQKLSRCFRVHRSENHEFHRARARSIPYLELLESRLTPNGTISVTTNLDVADGDTSSLAALMANPAADGKISLREAIVAANQTP